MLFTRNSDKIIIFGLIIQNVDTLYEDQCDITIMDVTMILYHGRISTVIIGENHNRLEVDDNNKQVYVCVGDMTCRNFYVNYWAFAICSYHKDNHWMYDKNNQSTILHWSEVSMLKEIHILERFIDMLKV